MEYLFTLFLVVLFFVLTPGVLLSIPKNGKCTTQALVHAVIFGLIYHLTHNYLWKQMHV
jgi:hypothetical protein